MPAVAPAPANAPSAPAGGIVVPPLSSTPPAQTAPAVPASARLLEVIHNPQATVHDIDLLYPTIRQEIETREWLSTSLKMERVIETDPNPADRAKAVGVLYWMGSRGSVALPALIKALNDEQTFGLGNATNRQLPVQAVAASALGQMGTYATPALGALQDLETNARSPVARRAARQAITRIDSAIDAIEDRHQVK